MSAATHNTAQPYYFVPAPSRHPAMVALGLFFIIFGASRWINGEGWGAWVLLLGVLTWIFTMQQWFRQAIGESETGLYSPRIDVSFRWSMSWFIFSEVMFFSAFFGALYYVRTISLPALGDLDNAVLWPDFKAVWPSAAAGFTGSPARTVEPFTTMGPWPIPTLNTLILLSSGVTVTIAHHALIANARGRAIAFMWFTVLLGATFLGFQAYEFTAFVNEGLTVRTNLFGSTFFTLTGFHGAHVTVGVLWLMTLLWIDRKRGLAGPADELNVDICALYWHFVDLVWLGLFIFVYWL
jgi:cytochrome c oxidase subunit 3